jgi:tetraacyldisaccharide-1-P 4'-kinase
MALGARKMAIEAIVTTSKDAVKLRELRLEIPCYILEVTYMFDDEEELKRLVISAARSTSIKS